MLASLGDLGWIAGILILAVALVLALRPLKLHITVRHERDDADQESSEEDS